MCFLPRIYIDYFDPSDPEEEEIRGFFYNCVYTEDSRINPYKVQYFMLEYNLNPNIEKYIMLNYNNFSEIMCDFIFLGNDNHKKIELINWILDKFEAPQLTEESVIKLYNRIMSKDTYILVYNRRSKNIHINVQLAHKFLKNNKK